jgi:hypothetical protein
VRSVTAGFNVDCAARTDATVVCWGDSYHGPPSAGRCLSRRRFAIRIRKLPGVTFLSAVVKVRNKGVKRSRMTAAPKPHRQADLPHLRAQTPLDGTEDLMRTAERDYATR